MRRILVALALLCSCGGDSTGGADASTPPETREEWCVSMSQTYCSRMDQCSIGFADCGAITVDECCLGDPNVCAESITTTQADVQACADEIVATPCATLDNGELPGCVLEP